MNFQPETTIHFCRTGIDDTNKVVCHSQQELFDTLTKTGNVLGVMSKSSFQRADNFFIIRVDHADIKYYSLLQCDTVIYLNDDQPGQFYIVGNIIAVDWKNEDCSFVTFKIDSFMTYQTFIDWGNTYAFVEREHIKDDWASDGGNPLYSNFGPSEGFGTVADVPFYSWKKNFNPTRVLIQSPYDISGQAIFAGGIKANLFSSMQNVTVPASQANQFFQQIADNPDATINNIVGVYGIPDEFSQTIDVGGMAFGLNGQTETVPAVNVAAKQLPSMIEYNNAKCWAAPFVQIRLMSSDGDTKDFNPQWLGNDQSEYTIRYRAGGAGGMFGAAQCTFENKNGAFNWDVWKDFIVQLSQLPSCPWTADGFRDYNSVFGARDNVNTVSTIVGAVIGSVQAVLGAAKANDRASNSKNVSPVGAGLTAAQGVLNVASSVMNGVSGIFDLNASIQQEKANGATVTGGGSFSALTDIASNNWGFQLVYYSTQIYAMRSVDAYFDRFGYLVNRLKKLELENRPIWTFVKTLECHVVSTSGIPYIHQQAINAMFNGGVTMWKQNQYIGGQLIGDFSKAHDNRGIQGG